MARKPALLKYDRIRDDIPVEGCGSHCPDCKAKLQGHCDGCNKCFLNNNCPNDGCSVCGFRCWRRDNLKEWLDDINQLELNTPCTNVFADDLPPYIPQVQNNAFGVDYPAFIINIHRILHPTNRTWCYRRYGVKKHYNIPHTSKLILSFCSKDELLEQIWTRAENWYRDESFWDGIIASKTRGGQLALQFHGIDASMSVEFSCLANTPRLEHLINIKRNIISAHELSKRGMPILLDTMVRTNRDLTRMLEWSKDNKLVWHVLNFQRTQNVQWMNNLIHERIEQILAYHKRNRVIVMGISDPERVKALIIRYPGRISISNTLISMKTNYHQKYDNGQWHTSDKPLPLLFAHNLAQYIEEISL